MLTETASLGMDGYFALEKIPTPGGNRGLSR